MLSAEAAEVSFAASLENSPTLKVNLRVNVICVTGRCGEGLKKRFMIRASAEMGDRPVRPRL